MSVASIFFVCYISKKKKKLCMLQFDKTELKVFKVKSGRVFVYF